MFHISRIRTNLFIHIARIPIGDSPQVHPNILKCSLHSPVAKGIRLVVFATRAMVCDTPTHYLILNSLASARGRVILRSHFLILLLLIILISLYLVGMSVALFCDNTTTVAYLRRSGGTFSATLNATAREILLWAENRRIRLLPQFIMGSSNVTADVLSRPNQVIGSEWTLHQEVVDQLVHKWPAVIDLFATSLTARLPVYFSPASDPRAAWTDALLQSWDDLQAYAFPPIAIIRRVLLKLRSSKNCELTLIAPFWPQRDWFPDLLELLSDVPVTLSGRRDLLRQPHFHRFHLNLPMLQLTAWRLSSDSPSKPASLLRWLDSLSSVEDCPRA